MKAVVVSEYGGALHVEDLTPSPLGPNDARVRIDASGVCHTDLSASRGELPVPLPTILGHEATGTVVEVGASVTRVAPGDVVVASFVPACGTCFFCLRGQSHLCETSGGLAAGSTSTRDDGAAVHAMVGLGTFADEMTVHESMLVRIDTDVPAEQLALIGCGVTTGLGAVLNTAAVKPGSTVAVIGCGGVGQAVVQGARIAGAAGIFAVDPVELKRAAAVSAGATQAIDPNDGDPIEQIRDATAGRGADYAFEVVGSLETFAEAIAAARKGGVVVFVGMTAMGSTVQVPATFMTEEKTLKGCLYGSAQVRSDFPRFVGLIEAGRLDVGSMVSRSITLDDVDDAFQAMEAGEVIRSVIVP